MKKKLSTLNIFLFIWFCVLFVCIDINFQYYFGKDIFGLKEYDRRLSGPFGDELIAGSLFKDFLFLSFLYIYFFKTIKIFKILFLFTCNIILAAFLSGNRMPIVTLFLYFLNYFFINKHRKSFILI